MTPPLCVWCEAQPVKPAQRNAPAARRGIRMVDGQRWRWFCSQACSAHDRMAHQEGYQNALKARSANIRKSHERILKRIIDACKGQLDERGRVDPKDLVRAMMYELRLADQRQRFRRRYHDGFAA